MRGLDSLQFGSRSNIYCPFLNVPCHQYTQYDNTRTRVWYKGYEDDMKETSSSVSVPSRVIVRVDLSVRCTVYPRNRSYNRVGATLEFLAATFICQIKVTRLWNTESKSI